MKKSLITYMIFSCTVITGLFGYVYFIQNTNKTTLTAYEPPVDRIDSMISTIHTATTRSLIRLENQASQVDEITKNALQTINSHLQELSKQFPDEKSSKKFKLIRTSLSEYEKKLEKHKQYYSNYNDHSEQDSDKIVNDAYQTLQTSITQLKNNIETDLLKGIADENIVDQIYSQIESTLPDITLPVNSAPVEASSVTEDTQTQVEQVETASTADLMLEKQPSQEPAIQAIDTAEINITESEQAKDSLEDSALPEAGISSPKSENVNVEITSNPESDSTAIATVPTITPVAQIAENIKPEILKAVKTSIQAPELLMDVRKRISILKQLNHYQERINAALSTYITASRSSKTYIEIPILTIDNNIVSGFNYVKEVNVIRDNIANLQQSIKNAIERNTNSHKSNTQAALGINKELIDNSDALLKNIQNLLFLKPATTTKLDQKKSDQKKSNFSLIFYITCLIALLFMIWLSIKLIKQSNNWHTIFSSAFEKLAIGDLSFRINADKSDDILSDQYNHAVIKIESMINGLQNEILRMESTIPEVDDVLDDAELQEALDNLQLAHEKYDHYVAQVNEENESIDILLKTMLKDTQTGQHELNSTVESIQRLENDIEKTNQVIATLKQNSEEIGNVVDVIRGIADQTNLLALNAAIEAARAGEQGRGFAVVADEVRTLASRTQHSTEEIESMIDNVQSVTENAVLSMSQGSKQVEISLSNAHQASASMANIDEMILKITESQQHINKG